MIYVCHVCVCVRIYIYIYIHYIYIFMYYVCVCVCKCMCVYIYIYKTYHDYDYTYYAHIFSRCIAFLHCIVQTIRTYMDSVIFNNVCMTGMALHSLSSDQSV